MLNPTWKLPTPEDKTKEESWGVLVAADGSDFISMLINPLSIQRGITANTAKFAIYNSNSRVIWVSNNPETINLSLVVSGGAYADVSPVLDKLRVAVGKKWIYVHSQRVLPTAILTNLDIDERQWYEGRPTMADVSLQFMTTGATPITVISYPDPSAAEIDDYLKQAAALGFTNLSAQGLNIFSRNTLIGTGLNGSFFPF